MKNVLYLNYGVFKNFAIFSVVAKKLGCRLKIKFRRLKEELSCLLCFTDSSPAKNPAGDLRFFSRWISPAVGT